MRSPVLRTCRRAITPTGCGWRRKRRGITPCWSITWPCWAMRTGTFPPTPACGKWCIKPAATCWRAWRWCREHWRRGAWMPSRPCAPSWPRRETWPPPPSSTSSCARKWGMSRSATAGTAICASSAAWNCAPPMPNWRCATKRPPCAARSTWKRGAGPGFRSWNCPTCPPEFVAASRMSRDADVPVAQVSRFDMHFDGLDPGARARDLVGRRGRKTPVDEGQLDEAGADVDDARAGRRRFLGQHGPVRRDPRQQGRQFRLLRGVGRHFRLRVEDQLLDGRAIVLAAQCIRVATRAVRVAQVDLLAVAVAVVAEDGIARRRLCHMLAADVVEAVSLARQPGDGQARGPGIATRIARAVAPRRQRRLVVGQVQGNEGRVALEFHLPPFGRVGTGVRIVDAALQAQGDDGLLVGFCAGKDGQHQAGEYHLARALGIGLGQ